MKRIVFQGAFFLMRIAETSFFNPFGTKIAQSVRLKWVFDLSSKIDLFLNHKNRSQIVVFCLFPMFFNTISRKFLQSVRLKWVSDLSSKNGLFQKARCST